MSAFVIRLAGVEDADFLLDMLVEAVNWEPGRAMPREQILADPALAHYVTGWPRADDVGVVAETADGTPAGAAWLRHFTDRDPGYGYAGPDVPELSMGVAPPYRRRGVGRMVLRAILAQANTSGRPAVSLSVERANFAARLYRSEGFRTVASFENADTMVIDCRHRPPQH